MGKLTLGDIRRFLRMLKNYARHYLSREIVINGYFFYNEDYTLKHNNFGDDINFPLIEALTGRLIKQQWLTGIPNIPTLYCIGSIVESLFTMRQNIWMNVFKVSSTKV